ncbi:MAG: hypothetical protein JWL77_2847 [Chthonomonadaceae bacterium]|nr:hypothetical protein [Chthonomonadaceae bacterium]
MKTSSRFRFKPSVVQRIELIALPLLIGAAVFFWTAPMRAERALKNASFDELRAASRRDPDNPRVFYYLGIRLRDLGQLGPADAAFARAATLDAASEEIWLAWAATAAVSGKDQEAFEAFDKCVQAHPDSKEAHLALALFCHEHYALQRAYEEAAAAARCDPKDAAAWRLAGVTALQLQDLKGAEGALRKAATLAPRDWRAQLGLGQTLSAQHRSPEALECYQHAAVLAPEQAAVTLILGQTQLLLAKNNEEREAARRTLAHAAQQNPNSGEALLSLAQALGQLQRWQEARTTLQAAEIRIPRNAQVHFELARIDRQTGDAAEAARETLIHSEIKSYDEARLSLGSQARTSNDPRIRLKLARLYTAHGDFKEAKLEYRNLMAHASQDHAAQTAQRELDRLEQGHPETPPVAATSPLPPEGAGSEASLPALLKDADSILAQKRFPEAEKAYLQIVVRDPQSARAFQGMGLALASEGKTEQAFLALGKAMKLDPHLSQAQFALAHLYYDQGFVDEAARRMEVLIRDAPTNGEYLHALALCYLDDTTRYLETEELLKRAVAREPKRAAYWRDLGKAEVNLTHSADAENDYRQAIALDPEGPDTQLALGSFLLDHQPSKPRLQEAERLLKAVTAKDPANADGLLGLGRVALSRSDIPAALAYLQHAVAHNPNLAAGWYHLARAFDRAGDSARAKDCRTAFQNITNYRRDLNNTEEAARSHLKDPALRLKLARLYVQGGQNARAINQYQVYLSLAPADKGVQKELQTLTSHLQTSGQMPSMNALNGMLLTSLKAH